MAEKVKVVHPSGKTIDVDEGSHRHICAIQEKHGFRLAPKPKPKKKASEEF